jgi:AcrR family transcriptional regulator
MRPDIYDSADLTARARIRDAVLALVAERGVAGATVRGIAERSGVSPSLVLHHFGSKQGVIDETSSWVIHLLRDETRAADRGDSPAGAHVTRLAIVGRLLTETPNLSGYLRRMLIEATPEGVSWFREAVATTAADIRDREDQGLARRSADVEAETALLLVLALAPMLLQPLLEPALGVDFSDEAARARWRDAQQEMLTSALYPPQTRS